MKTIIKNLVVKPWGNTAGVMVSRRFIGRKVTVVVHDAEDAVVAADDAVKCISVEG